LGTAWILIAGGGLLFGALVPFIEQFPEIDPPLPISVYLVVALVLAAWPGYRIYDIFSGRNLSEW
jgi:hypothetical protein